MIWDWSYFKTTEFVVGVAVFGLLFSVVGNMMSSAIEGWRHRRNAQRREQDGARSARKQSLFEFRVKEAKQDRFKAMMLFHRAHVVRLIGVVWQVGGVILMAVGTLGYFLMASVLEKIEGLKIVAPLSCALTAIGGFMAFNHGYIRTKQSWDFIDPFIRTLAESDKPFLFSRRLARRVQLCNSRRI